MNNIITFRLKKSPTRENALNWLRFFKIEFPDDESFDDKFHGWRFIKGLDGIVYFANCIEPGITKSELESIKTQKEIPA